MELMHGVPWQVMQEIISVIPPATEEPDKKKEEKSMDFMDFGKKLMGI